MTIAASIKKLLDTHRVSYRVFNHKRTKNLEQAVQILKINKKNVLTTRILSDNLGLVLAVFPVENRIDFIRLRKQLNRNLCVLPDFKVNRLFEDCEAGSHPPFGSSYGLEVLLEKSIELLDCVYFEAGCHTSFVQLSIDDFLYLNAEASRIDIVGSTKPIISSDFNLDLRFDLEKQNNPDNFTFPSLSSFARKILELSCNKNRLLKDLVLLIADDKIISRQILSYAKLPFISGNSKYENIDEVVPHILSFDTVSHIAFSIAAGRVFKQSNQDINLREFWRHAIYAAVIAERISIQVPKEKQIDPCVSYLGGLLHNFGFLLFSELFPPEFRLLKKWIRLNPKVPINILEMRLLGMGQALHALRGGHSNLGYCLLRYWDIPQVICVIAKEHHVQNYVGEYADYVNIIQVTNQILRAYNIGDGHPGKVSSKIVDNLGLKITNIEKIVEEVMSAAEGLELIAKGHIV